jgi:hypothetical protein
LRRAKKIMLSSIIAGIVFVSTIFLINVLYTGTLYTDDGVCDLCDSRAKYEVYNVDYSGVKSDVICELCIIHFGVWSIGNPVAPGGLMEAKILLFPLFFAPFTLSYYGFFWASKLSHPRVQ